MKLFRVAMKSVNSWDKKIRTLYIIQQSKTDAITYVNNSKSNNFEIDKIWYLGHALSGYMFKGGKELTTLN